MASLVCDASYYSYVLFVTTSFLFLTSVVSHVTSIRYKTCPAFACFLQAEPSVTMGPCQGAEAHICQLPQAPAADLPSSVLPGKYDSDSEPEVRPISV